MNRTFRTHEGREIKNIVSYIKEYIEPYPDCEIYVGCDSQVNQRYTVYSVVIGIHKIVDGIGRGVHIVHSRERNKKLNGDVGNIIKRLWKEVNLIVETAIYLRDNGINVNDINTHVDANVNKNAVSNKIYDSAIGWLNQLGFKVEGKPYAWAATYAAGKYCQ